MHLVYHYFPASHWSRVASQVLCEKDLWDDADRRVVDIRRNKNYEPEYVRLNPKGVVPTVVIDGSPVCDTPVIVRALDALAEPIVHPDDPLMDAWAGRLEAVKLMHLSYHVWTAGHRGEKSAAILEDKVSRASRYAAMNPDLAALYERKRQFFATFRAEVYDVDHQEQTRAETRAVLDALADHVARTPFVVGETWTWADAICASILWRLEDLDSGLAVWKGDDLHPIAAYYARLRARPSFRTVFYDDPALASL